MVVLAVIDFAVDDLPVSGESLWLPLRWSGRLCLYMVMLWSRAVMSPGSYSNSGRVSEEERNERESH